MKNWRELRERYPELPENPDGYHRHRWEGGWVSDDSLVTEDCYIGPDCIVDGKSKVIGKSKVSGGSRITGGSLVANNSWIYQSVVDDSYIDGGSRIICGCLIAGGSRVTGGSHVRGGSRVVGSRVAGSQLDGGTVVGDARGPKADEGSHRTAEVKGDEIEPGWVVYRDAWPGAPNRPAWSVAHKSGRVLLQYRATRAQAIEEFHEYKRCGTVARMLSEIEEDE